MSPYWENTDNDTSEGGKSRDCRRHLSTFRYPFYCQKTDSGTWGATWGRFINKKQGYIHTKEAQLTVSWRTSIVATGCLMLGYSRWAKNGNILGPGARCSFPNFSAHWKVDLDTRLSSAGQSNSVRISQLVVSAYLDMGPVGVRDAKT